MYFYLLFCDAEPLRQVKPLRRRQILLVLEHGLQLEDLPARERRPDLFGLLVVVVVFDGSAAASSLAVFGGIAAAHTAVTASYGSGRQEAGAAGLRRDQGRRRLSPDKAQHFAWCGVGGGATATVEKCTRRRLSFLTCTCKKPKGSGGQIQLFLSFSISGSGSRESASVKTFKTLI